ncbi:MAG TPA: Bcr/CflA family drug resistance efflux transporter [Oceanospirillaceae bacterium]|nr:Bcr/CflA family drug resistance efflux transporter [Oceanospirillaceae bacterium]
MAMFTIIAMVSPVALNILLPALPDMANDLNLPTSAIQLTLTLYLLALAIGQLLLGPLADRFGRRPVLLAGIVIHMLGCVVAATANDLTWLLVGRVLQALGGCTGMALARTIMLDRHSREVAAGKLGYITLSIGLSQAIAPTLGGYMNLMWGWQSLFYFSMILGSLSWLIVVFKLPETGTQHELRLSRVLMHYVEVMKSPGYLPYALSTAVIASGFYVFIGSAPYLVADQLKGSSADYGIWFLWVSVGFMAGSFVAAKISKNQGIKSMILSGHLLSLLGGIMLLFSLYIEFSYLGLFLPMALYTFGRGFSQPNSQSAAISSTCLGPSTASGMIGFMQLTTGALVAQATPWLIATNSLLIPALILLCPILGLVIMSKINNY